MCDDANERNGSGNETRLIALAAGGGSADDVQLLLASGADAAAATADGRSALYFAAQQGHAALVDVLVCARADCNQADSDGITPLWAASSNGHESCVQALLHHRADVDMADHEGNTPLIAAAQDGLLGIVQALLKGRANVNQANSDEATPLILSMQYGHTPCVEALVRGGADLTLTWRNLTALDVAIENGLDDIASVVDHPQLAAERAAHGDRHRAAEAKHRASGNVAVTRRRGGGFVGEDYTLHFKHFNTFAADVRLWGGCFYWEVQVLDSDGELQLGVCNGEFQACESFCTKGRGVGDDACSWAVDGTRMKGLHMEQYFDFGSAWTAGDVIGFALHMLSPSASVLSVSVNGCFTAPNGVAFGAISAPQLSPAFSGRRRCRANFGDRPFAHQPPNTEYISVHSFLRLQQPHAADSANLI
jgi:hypothetical protein